MYSSILQGVHMEGKNRISFAVIVLIILLAVASAFVFILWREKSKADAMAAEYKMAYENLKEEQERAEQAAKDERKKSQQYAVELRNLSDLMLHGLVIAEDSCNQRQSVWHNSIYKIKDKETDKFTLDSKGNFHDDFNTALGNLYGDKEYVSLVQELSDNQYEVTEKMRELKDPPEEWKNAYADLLIYYDSYYDFTELALGSGHSLSEFEELFEKYDEESVKRYKKMKIYVE